MWYDRLAAEREMPDEATVAEAVAGSEAGEGSGEAAMFGVMDVAIVMGLVVVCVGLLLRWRRKRKERNTLRKLSINPRSEKT